MADAALARYRTPLPGRVFVVVFTVGFIGFLGSFLLRDDATPAAVLIPVAMALLALAACARSLRIGADLFAEQLVVRNFVRTRRIARADVADIRIGAALTEDFEQTIRLVTRDGSTVAVQALNTRSQEALEARRDELRAWWAGAAPGQR